MRRFTSLSAATAAALVLSLTGATASQAGGTTPASSETEATTTRDTARAAGLIVTSRSSRASIESAVTAELDGVATLDGSETVETVPWEGAAAASTTTRVVSFDEPVTGAVAERLAGELSGRADIVSAEPDYVVTATDVSPVPVNDPRFSEQRNIWDSVRPGGGYSVKAPAFWARSVGAGVRVAVLDTGATNHPDLVWEAGRDVVSGDNDPTDAGPTRLDDPGRFHGTHVAGTVGARANNSVGVVGVAPGAALVPVRVLDGDGGGTISQVVKGILWASGATVDGVTNPAPVQVITMSLSGQGACASTIASAVDYARSRGIVVIAAAGNTASDAAGYVPANCPGVIAVGATDVGGARATFSNLGSTVDISAPGVGVLSTSASRPAGGQDQYRPLDGTSMAAPAVAGAAALLASTGLDGAQIEYALPRMVTPATSAGTPGILNLAAAIQTKPPAPPLAPKASTKVSLKAPQKVAKGKRVRLRVALRSPTGARPYGRLRVYDGSTIIRRVTVSTRRGGTITINTPKLRKKGTHKLRVVYLGEDVFNGSRSVLRRVKVK